MLHPDPLKRWSAKRLKTHPVFAHVDMDAVCDRAGHGTSLSFPFFLPLPLPPPSHSSPLMDENV